MNDRLHGLCITMTMTLHSCCVGTWECCLLLYCPAILYCTVLYCTVLYFIVLYCTVLYCTVLYCTVLYYTVPSLRKEAGKKGRKKGRKNGNNPPFLCSLYIWILFIKVFIIDCGFLILLIF